MPNPTKIDSDVSTSLVIMADNVKVSIKANKIHYPKLNLDGSNEWKYIADSMHVHLFAAKALK